MVDSFGVCIWVCGHNAKNISNKGTMNGVVKTQTINAVWIDFQELIVNILHCVNNKTRVFIHSKTSPQHNYSPICFWLGMYPPSGTVPKSVFLHKGFYKPMESGLGQVVSCFALLI